MTNIFKPSAEATSIYILAQLEIIAKGQNVSPSEHRSTSIMNFTDQRPRSIQSLEFLLNQFVDSGHITVDDFDSIESDGKRLILQLLLVADYREDTNSQELPTETRNRIADTVTETKNDHALSGLFDLNAIEPRGHTDNLETVYEQLTKTSDLDQSRVFFREASTVLEEFLSYEAEVNNNTIEYVESDDRRVSGTYLTPLQLAQRCCRPSLVDLIEDRCTENKCWPGNINCFDELEKDVANDAINAILSLNLVDPACGTGSMLLAVVDILTSIVAQLKARENEPSPSQTAAARQAIIKNCIFGVDVNRLSTDTALGVLWVEAAENIDDSFAELSEHFASGDSLLGHVNLQKMVDTPSDENKDARTYREGLESIHWGQTFPDVFNDGGFDAVLTNPPWERVKVQTREFFAGRKPKLSTVATTAEREVELHKRENGRAKAALEEAKKRSKSFADAIRNSNQYQWTNVGSLNLYSLFAERSLHLTKETGRIGLIVPTGIATDYYTRDFFEHLVTSGKLESLYDFENREKHFEDVDGRTRFSLVTICNEPGESVADYVFFAHNPEDLDDGDRHVTLTADDIAELNPNTRTCPLVRGRSALRILQKQHEAAPILSKDGDNGEEENPWEVNYFRMFDMSLDSDTFHQASELQNGTRLQNGYIQLSEKKYTRVYEGRMIDQYNHRASHAKNSENNIYRSGASEAATPEQLKDPDFTVAARYYVTKEEVDNRMADRDYNRDWFIGFKDITSATNTRTMIASVLPYTAIGNKVPVLLADHPAQSAACFLANLNSLAYDFACRQKIGNVTLNWYIVRQTPVFPPETFEQMFQGTQLRDWVAARVAELTYTAHDLDAWGDDLGFADEPYTWDDDRRREIRIDLEALFFNLYGLSEDEVDHVFESFWSVKENEINNYGEYRLKKQVINRLDDFQSLSPSS